MSSSENHPCYQLLLPQHVAFLKARAVAPAEIEARGYRSIDRKVRLKELGFSSAQQRVPALLIPIYGVTGEIVSYQSRPDDPRLNEKSKSIKYETIAGSRMALDVPKRIRLRLGDPKVDLFITEGAPKADAAVGQGLCCIAVLGVSSWRGTNEHGGKTALPDWEMIAIKERQVYICFDSDVMTKPQVYRALVRLKQFLEMRGAKVFLIYLPAGEEGAKVGLDDFFAANHAVEDLLSLATDTLREPPHDDEEGSSVPYEATDQGLTWFKGSKDGVVRVPLTNFTAQIVADTVEDDGVETHRTFDIEARLKGHTRRFVVAADHFAAMSWATEQLGAQALVYPGINRRDHARAAVQLLSQAIMERRVFKHTGWRQSRDGDCFYFHGGGVLGGAGHVPEMEVALPDGLSAFILPSPPSKADLVIAIKASLALLDVAPDHVTVPLWTAIYRAVLGSADFSGHLTGPTGEGKTELAALVQQHYGAGFDARHLPARWSSTANALEGIAFAMKDAICVVDDFAPGGSHTDVARMHRDADRLLRAQGNLSGRQRMRPDATLRPAKPPRGLIISTGEDVPRGQSLRARLFTVELSPGDVAWEKLTRCQEDGAKGLYAEALAGFVQWLAPQYAQVKLTLRSDIAELRQQASREGQHRRTPEIMANLLLGVRYFLRFAGEVGALSSDESGAVWRRCWDGLDMAAGVQRRQQEASEPTRRFFELLAAALASGRAHVASSDGQEPISPVSWGWRKVTVETGPYARDEWRPQGKRVGWLDGENLYLEPEASYAEVQALAGQQGESLPVTAATLRKRLYERKLLVATADMRQTYTIRHTLEGVRRPVLHTRTEIFWSYISQKPAQPAQPAQDGEQTEKNSNGQVSEQISGQVAGQVFSPDLPEKKPEQSNGSDNVGRLGRFFEDRRDTLSERDASPSYRQAFEQGQKTQNLPNLPINSENLPTPHDHPADDDEWEEGLI